MAQDTLLQQLLGVSDGADGSEGGLTPAALQECAHKVEIRREEVLLTLYANVAERMASDTYEEEANEASGSAAHQLDTAVLEADVAVAFSSVLAQLQSEQHAALAAEDPSVAQLAALGAQHAAVLAAMQETVMAAASVRVTAELHQRLTDFDAAVAAGSYSEAAWIALELQKAVQAVLGSEDTAAAVLARVQPLQQQLMEGVYGCCTIDPASRMPILIPSAGSERLTISGASTSSTVGTAAVLAEIWKALEVFGMLPQALQQLAAYFLEHSVQPILASEHDPSLITDSPAGSVASSNLSRATTMGGGRSGGNSVERLLYKALRALAETVIGGQEKFVEQLGAVLWPQLAAAYITVKLKPIQPQSDAEVELYSRKSALGGKLEQKAVKLHLLPADKEGPITRYIKHTLNKFLNLRRNRFIAAARDLLLSSAAQETVTVGVPCRLTSSGTPKAASRSLFGSAQAHHGAAAGSGGNGGLDNEDPLLACGEYAISKAALGSVNLMREALTEAVRSGNTALAQAMCGAVVDVAAMMVALPAPAAAAAAAGGGKPPHPAATPDHQHAGGELLLPYPASLRHNDCHYVYQALCNLPYHFAPRLQHLVHRNLNFVNPATRVRHAGQDALQAMVMAQEGELLGVVEELQRFAGLDGDGQAGIRCRKGVQQLLQAYRRLGGVLRGVLAPGVLIEVVAQLIQSVCGQITEDIMLLPDISVDESEQIPAILEPLTAGIRDAVLPQAPEPGSEGQAGQQAGTVGGVGAEELAAVLAERTPAVMKLQELCELLDIRMVEIRRRWQEGRLQALGFSAKEVAHLVQALFEDTDLRRDFLQLLDAQQAEEEATALL